MMFNIPQIVSTSIFIGVLLFIMQVLIINRLKPGIKALVAKFYMVFDFVLGALAVFTLGGQSTTSVSAAVINMLLVSIYLKWLYNKHNFKESDKALSNRVSKWLEKHLLEEDK